MSVRRLLDPRDQITAKYMQIHFPFQLIRYRR